MMKNNTHRWINTLLFVSILMVGVWYTVSHQHSMEDCEARLYEKITGQKLPDTKGVE